LSMEFWLLLLSLWRRVLLPRPQTLLPGQELPYRVHKLLGFLQRWHMPTAVDDVQSGVRQRLLIQLATVDRDDDVLLAPDDERRGLDAAQVGGQFRVVQVRFPA